ncbi:MAG: hypothetical protein ACLQVI_42680 [Polyangiaceae bacterium]
MAPSGPAAIFHDSAPTGNSVMSPHGEIRPMSLPPNEVNQRLPSGPTAMPWGCSSFGIAYSIGTAPGVVAIFATLFAPCSTNQTFPSGPATMPAGRLSGVGAPPRFRWAG